METNIFEVCDNIIWVEPDMINGYLYDYEDTWYIHLTPPDELILQTTIICTS